MVPRAGTLYGLGISITTSGLMFHPSRHSMGGGMSFGSPSGAPASTHATSVLTSASVSLRSFAKWPNRGSANHGGIFFVSTASLIDLAHGRVLSYVRSDDRADLARPMTALTVLLHDGKNVFVVGDRRIRRRGQGRCPEQ